MKVQAGKVLPCGRVTDNKEFTVIKHLNQAFKYAKSPM